MTHYRNMLGCAREKVITFGSAITAIPRSILNSSKAAPGKRFSIRIGDHYRAIGQVTGDVVEWVWIGSHEDYNKLV